MAVPVVVSRVFEQILPTLEPVLLSQSGGQSIAATVTATGLRSAIHRAFISSERERATERSYDPV